MIGQSFAIIAVILIMAFMSLRTGRSAGAIFSLPLISVSAFHLIGLASNGLFISTGLYAAALHIAADSAGLLLGVFLCWKLSRAIVSRRIRHVYFICCVIFLVSLTAVYITNHI